MITECPICQTPLKSSGDVCPTCAEAARSIAEEDKAQWKQIAKDTSTEIGRKAEAERRLRLAKLLVIVPLFCLFVALVTIGLGISSMRPPDYTITVTPNKEVVRTPGTTYFNQPGTGIVAYGLIYILIGGLMRLRRLTKPLAILLVIVCAGEIAMRFLIAFRLANNSAPFFPGWLVVILGLILYIFLALNGWSLFSLARSAPKPSPTDAQSSTAA